MVKVPNLLRPQVLAGNFSEVPLDEDYYPRIRFTHTNRANSDKAFVYSMNQAKTFLENMCGE